MKGHDSIEQVAEELKRSMHLFKALAATTPQEAKPASTATTLWLHQHHFSSARLEAQSVPSQNNGMEQRLRQQTRYIQPRSASH